MSWSGDFYMNIVEDLWRDRNSKVISCKKPEHISRVYSLFLDEARESILIFHPNLEKDIFEGDEILGSLIRGMKKGKRIELVSRIPDYESRFVKQLRINGNSFLDQSWHDLSKISFARQADLDYVESLNFAVADGHAYHFSGRDNSRTYPPVVSMKNVRVSHELEELFLTFVKKIPSVKETLAKA